MDLAGLTKFVRRNSPTAVIAAASVVAFAGTFHAQFVWDDETLIVYNPYVQKLSGAWFWFTHPYLWSYYRPLPGLSFNVETALWKDNPLGFHLTNLAVFAVTSILLYLLVNRLFADRRLAFASALIFAVHPVHSEPVAWVSGRPDLLCGLFLLLSMLLFVQWQENRRALYRIGSLLAFAAAALSKEMALTALPFLFALTYLDGKDKQSTLKDRLLQAVPYLLVAAAYIAARQVAVNVTPPPGGEPDRIVATEPLMSRIIGTPVNLVTYLKISMIPSAASPCRHPAVIASFADPVFLASCGLLALVGAVVGLLRKRLSFLFWPAVWLLVMLLPGLVINLIPGQMIGERYTYIASFAASVIAAAVLLKLWNTIRSMIGTAAGPVGLLAFAGLLTILTVITWKGNAVWENDFTLWSSVVRHNPTYALAHHGLGLAFREKGLDDDAIEEFRATIRLQPHFSTAHLNLGKALADQGQPEEAAVEYRKALQGNDHLAEAYIRLARLYEGLTPPRIPEATALLEKGADALPDDPLIAYNLAYLYLLQENTTTQKTARIAQLLAKVVEKVPSAEVARLELGRAYAKLGRIPEARKQFRLLAETSSELRSNALTELNRLRHSQSKLK